MGTKKWLEEPRGVDIIERREFYTQMNHMIYVGRMKREYVRREVPILTLFKPLFNSPVSSLFLKSRGEKMGTGVVFPGSCHVYTFKVDVPRGQSQRKSSHIHDHSPSLVLQCYNSFVPRNIAVQSMKSILLSKQLLFLCNVVKTSPETK